MGYNQIVWLYAMAAGAFIGIVAAVILRSDRRPLSMIIIGIVGAILANTVPFVVGISMGGTTGAAVVGAAGATGLLVLSRLIHGRRIWRRW